MEVKSFVNKIIRVGCNSKRSIKENGSIVITNIISLLLSIFSLVTFVVSIVMSLTHLECYIDFFCAFLFFGPYYFNYKNRIKLSRRYFMLTISILLIVSSIVFEFPSYLKLGVIFIISYVYLVFEVGRKSFEFYFLLFYTLIFVAFFEVVQYKTVLSLNSELLLTHKIFDTITYDFIILILFISFHYQSLLIKKSEEEMSLYQKIFDSSMEAISIIDSDAHYIKQNEVHHQLIGYTDEELIGKSPELHMEKDALMEIRESLLTTGTYSGDVISHTPRGPKYINMLSFVIEDSIYQPYCIVCIKRDVTEKLALEQELRESEQNLREANVAKNKFFSIISHDLKSPFNSILGFSDLMLRKELTPEKMKQFAKHINDASQRTYQLLDDLLCWARLQQNKIQVNLEQVDIAAVLRNISSYSVGSANSKNITLEVNIEENLFVNGDKYMLETVFRNLVSNAIKFSKEGDRILLKSFREDDKVCVLVCDTGVGIQPENMSKLFKIDETFTTEGTNAEKGTGLGLILCKEFIDKNNGEISVRSTLGEGTEFIVRLPMT